ncbi:MAG: PAS domain S-box protein [Burkholderiaceae bacterium]|nr:PAS domain S-box protein [Burkholderiaceae bacterium]
MESPNPTPPSTTPLELAFASAIHASQDAIVIVDDRQQIVLFNPAAQRMFGCSEASAIGSPLSRFIPERHRQAHEAHVRRFDGPGSAERPMWGRAPIRGLRATGEEFPARAMITRVEVPTEAGPGRYFTALLHDLSRERDLEAELDVQAVRMRSVFDLAPIAIWLTDGESIVYANAVCAELFAATDSRALVGKSIFALLHPQSHRPVREQMSQVWEKSDPVSLVHERIVQLDGHHRDVDIAMAAMPSHGRTILQMVITDISKRTQERRMLERSRLELQRLSAKQVDTREAERRHIARELHDELGQRLSSLKMELSSLAKTKRSETADRITPMLEMVDDTVAAVRRISTDLRPMMLDDLGLSAALEWLTHESARRMGLEIGLKLDEANLPTDEQGSITIFRIVQEALTNVARHAHASRVQVEAQRCGDHLVLSVEDNGIGFSEPCHRSDGSLGLIGIRERVQILGGHLEIGNAPSGGARITVSMPLAQTVAISPDMPLSRKSTEFVPGAEMTRAAPRSRRPQLLEPSIEALTHELRVHQVELQMQNDELQRAQVNLAAARDRYADLYDFAPVGYFTLDQTGQIIDANLTGAALLGTSRASLMGRSFSQCVASHDTDRWQRHLSQAFGNEGGHHIELMLQTSEGGTFEGQIDSLRAIRAECQPTLRVILTDITERRRAEMDRHVAITTIGISEEQRRTFARELHEELGQRLSTLKMDLSGFQYQNERRGSDQRIIEMMQTIDASLEAVRRIVTELRPLMLDDLGLNAALDWLAHESAKKSGGTVTLSVEDTDPPLDDARSVGLFRLAQAALTNVMRHASGQDVHIELRHRDGEVVLVVEAQGSGWPAIPLFSPPDATQTLRNQAHVLGGELSIDAGPGIFRKITFRLTPT